MSLKTTTTTSNNNIINTDTYKEDTNQHSVAQQLASEQLKSAMRDVMRDSRILPNSELYNGVLAQMTLVQNCFQMKYENLAKPEINMPTRLENLQGACLEYLKARSGPRWTGAGRRRYKLIEGMLGAAVGLLTLYQELESEIQKNESTEFAGYTFEKFRDMDYQNNVEIFKQDENKKTNYTRGYRKERIVDNKLSPEQEVRYLMDKMLRKVDVHLYTRAAGAFKIADGIKIFVYRDEVSVNVKGAFSLAEKTIINLLEEILKAGIEAKKNAEIENDKLEKGQEHKEWVEKLPDIELFERHYNGLDGQKEFFWKQIDELMSNRNEFVGMNTVAEFVFNYLEYATSYMKSKG